MDSKIREKVQRYLELSTKFNKSEDDVFSRYENIIESSSHIITCQGGYTSGVSGGYVELNLTGAQKKEPTKRERYEEATKNLLQLVDDYEEYKALQNDLLSYFEAENKLTK